jgi:hypothetical protein
LLSTRCSVSFETCEYERLPLRLGHPKNSISIGGLKEVSSILSRQQEEAPDFLTCRMSSTTFVAVAFHLIFSFFLTDGLELTGVAHSSGYLVNCPVFPSVRLNDLNFRPENFRPGTTLLRMCLDIKVTKRYKNVQTFFQALVTAAKLTGKAGNPNPTILNLKL